MSKKILSKKSKANSLIWKRERKRLVWLLLFPLAFILVKLAEMFPDTVEKLFSQKLYLFISTGISAITSLAPLSIAEIVVFALAIALLVMLIILCYRAIRRKLKFTGVFHAFLSLLIVFGVMLNLFYFLWGFNYYRPEISALMELDMSERSQKDLEELCGDLILEAKTLRNYLTEDVNRELQFESGKEFSDYFTLLIEAYKALGEKNDLFSRPMRSAKPVSTSKLMSYCGIAGIYIPYTAEANVNTDQPPLLQPVTAAHEMAHFIGFAREDEANFIAFLACTSSEDKLIHYSGLMYAIIHCMNRLCDIDTDAYKRQREAYSLAMERDLKAYNNYWKGFEGEISDVVNDINDSYLEANGEENGVESYTMMVDLLLAYYA